MSVGLYARKLFRNLLIVKIFLLAAASVFLCKVVVAWWMSSFANAWDAVFGLSVTLPHLLAWTVLAFAAINSYRKIIEVARRYARTPALDQLLFPDKVLWLVFCIAVVVVALGLVQGWNWEGVFQDNYSFVVIPMAYILLGILLPFAVGLATPNRRKHRRATRTAETRRTPLVGGDEPIQTRREDRLSRGAFIKQLHDIIANYQGAPSLVVGLSGEWGSGKTSCLYLLKEELREDETDLMVVDFNPWFFRDEIALIREFFGSIGGQLRTEYLIPGFGKYTQYVSRLLQSTTATIGPIGLSFRLTADAPTGEISRLKDSVERSLGAINRKVLILVDDVDRLPPNELVLLFKLVRLCGNFSKFIYVLCYDRKIIGELLEETGVTDSEAFLDKIVYMDLRLPQVDKRSLDEFVGDKLDQLFEEFGISLDKAQLERLRDLYTNHITNRVQNFREAKRLLASLTGVLAAVKGEVNIVDTIALESLRVFAGRVWNDIADSPDLYVLPLGTGYFTRRLLSQMGEEDKALQKTKKHLEQILGSQNPINRRFAQGVVEFLFPAAADALNGRAASYEHLQADYEREQRVALHDYLRKYLLQHVPVGIISSAQIAALVDQANHSLSPDEGASAIVQAFSAHQEGGVLYDLIQKLIFLLDQLKEKGDDAMVRAISEYSDRFSSQSLGLLDSEMDRARALLYALANKHKDSEKIQHVLKDAILTSRSMYFASSVIIWCTPDSNRIIESFDNINVTQLKDAYTERFKTEYIEPKKDILAADPSVVRYLLYPIDARALLTAYMLSLFEGRPARAGTLLLLYATDRHVSTDPQRWIFQYDDLKAKLEIEKLYEYVKTHKGEAYENDDEKWAVETFLKLHEQKTESPQASQG